MALDAAQAVVQTASWTVANWVEPCLPTMKTISTFLQREVPELLALAAKSLRQMPLPTTFSGFLELSQSQALDLAPPCCALLVAILVPICLLMGSSPCSSLTSAASNGKDSKTRNLGDSYWLTRVCLLRGQALCYACGFLVSAFQHRALWGSKGLEPLNPQFPGGRPSPVFERLALDIPWVPFDAQLELVSWFGLACSVLLFWFPCRSCLLPALTWVCYLSIINLQAPFTYSYGWEWLTCESGFLAIFLCPLPFADASFPATCPPPRIVLWLFRWLAFRLLLGAGLSKVGRNSSACWRQLTCTTTHYFTQPIPNPLSWFFHHLPEWVHRAEVATTFVEQLVLPFFFLIPSKWCRRLAAMAEIFFQFMIVATGNYAWINFIGALPCISMLDDEVLSLLFSKQSKARLCSIAEAAAKEGKRIWVRFFRLVHGFACIALLLFMAYKSKDPLKEMFSAAPWINNYDPWFLMNSQGVFGFINKHRVTLVLEYTHDPKVDMQSNWEPLDFRCIPGSSDRFPCLLSPYHSRLDWETWIRTTASMEQLYTQKAPLQEYFNRFPPFLANLIVHLLHGDDDTVSLMGVSRGSFFGKEGEPPSAIRARFYSYTFTSVERFRKTGHWWTRKSLDRSGQDGGVILTREQHPLEESSIRKSNPARRPVLLILFGIALMVGSSSLDWPLRVLMSALATVLFMVVFLHDYPLVFGYLEIPSIHEKTTEGLAWCQQASAISSEGPVFFVGLFLGCWLLSS